MEGAGMDEAATGRDGAGEDVDALALDALDPGHPRRFRDDTIGPVFARLRREAPVHFTPASMFGPYWSVCRYRDILHVEAHPEIYSSDAALGGITIRSTDADFRLPMFIAMDPPRHGPRRRVVAPAFAPENLARLEDTLRARAAAVFDALPVGETFDWVERVAVELTTGMLAVLMDFPWEERRKLTRWADIATALPGNPIYTTEAARRAELLECLARFTALWRERADTPSRGDFVSLLAHAEETRHMPPMEVLGNLLLLIVGGSDTTRNTIAGGLLALDRHPEQYRKLRDDPGLIAALVPEIVRWQTPLAHMRRTAVADAELGGRRIRAGDKVVLWYVSANRDPEAIEDPDRFALDRARPRKHLSFGFGVHRCLGERLAEMQLRVVWEELLRRHPVVEVAGEPRRVYSSFVNGYESLPVRIPARA